MITRSWTAPFTESLANLLERVLEILPNVLAAAGILLVGWLVARVVRAWMNRVLKQLHSLAGRSVDRELKASGLDQLASKAVGAIVFWFVIFAFLAAAGEVLGLAVVTKGLGWLMRYLPSILGAMLVLLAGIVFANLARSAVSKAARSAGIGYDVLLGQAARGVILLVSGVIVLDQLGIESELLIGSIDIVIASVIGGTALAFALGSRTAVSNILALHYVTQTYEIGQRIRVDGLEGEIVDFKKTGVIVSGEDGLVLIPAQEFSEKRSTLLHSGEE